MIKPVKQQQNPEPEKNIREAKEEQPDEVLESNSYIVKGCVAGKCFELLSSKVHEGFNGMCVTRTHPMEVLKNQKVDVPVLWLTNQKDENYSTTNNIKDVLTKIKQFFKKNNRSIVLLDRVDYMINMYGFNEFLKLVYALNDEVLAKNAILMINVNPDILKSSEVALLEQELKQLPSNKAGRKYELTEDLLEILNFINYNEKVTFKNVSKEFQITKTTTRKRINKLEELGLISVKKNGRNKMLRVTDSGRNYL